MGTMFPIYHSVHADAGYGQTRPEELLIVAAPDDFLWIGRFREWITASVDPVLAAIRICVPARPQAYEAPDFRTVYTRARHVLFVATAAFNRNDSSHWRAYSYARSLDPNGRDRRAIPVQIDDYTMSSLQTIDLRGLGPEAMRSMLINELSVSISGRRPRRTGPVPFPGKI